MAKAIPTKNYFGRTVLYTSEKVITRENLIKVLSSVLPDFAKNQAEIKYLYNYYRGDQPILKRKKKHRPEINNKVVENHAHEIVSFKVGYDFGEPIQYIRRATKSGTETKENPELPTETDDMEITGKIALLNEYMFTQDKATQDKDLAEWFFICGTGYRMVLPTEDELESEICPFEIDTLDPQFTAVVYSRGFGKKPVMSIQQVEQSDDSVLYCIYTPTTYFEVKVENALTDTNVTRSFIHDNAACQIGKGTLYARKRLERHLQKFYRQHGTQGWVLKCDLKNYFGSTPHKVAKEAISKRVNDDWACGEVYRIIDSFDQGEDPTVGMGLGSQVTQLIQLAVLDPIDHRIKERKHIKYYVRYMDDFILIHHDKAYLEECRRDIELWLSEMGLRLSEKKTQLAPITQPIPFLGFSFRLTDTGKIVKKIRPERISHERRKLRKLVQKAKNGYMTREQVDACYQSWKAHASYGDTHNLILQMDKFYKELWR